MQGMVRIDWLCGYSLEEVYLFDGSLTLFLKLVLKLTMVKKILWITKSSKKISFFYLKAIGH